MKADTQSFVSTNKRDENKDSNTKYDKSKFGSKKINSGKNLNEENELENWIMSKRNVNNLCVTVKSNELIKGIFIFKSIFNYKFFFVLNIFICDFPFLVYPQAEFPKIFWKIIMLNYERLSSIF